MYLGQAYRPVSYMVIQARSHICRLSVSPSVVDSVLIYRVVSCLAQLISPHLISLYPPRPIVSLLLLLSTLSSLMCHCILSCLYTVVLAETRHRAGQSQLYISVRRTPYIVPGNHPSETSKSSPQTGSVCNPSTSARSAAQLLCSVADRVRTT